jgi:hypothetical protein
MWSFFVVVLGFELRALEAITPSPSFPIYSVYRHKSIASYWKVFFKPFCSQSLCHPQHESHFYHCRMESENIYSFWSGFFHSVWWLNIYILLFACISSLFLFIAEQYSIIWIFQNLFICFDYFQIETIMNKCAWNVHVQVFLWICIFIFS